MFERLKQFNKEEKTPSFEEVAAARKAAERAAEEKAEKIAQQAKEDLAFQKSRERWKEHLLEHPQTFEISDEEVKEAEQWSKKNLKDKEQKAA